MKDSEWLQNFVGRCVLKFHRQQSIKVVDDITYYTVSKLYHSGISLGRYIIFDSRIHVYTDDVHHEYGHQIQSQQLGWKYLFKVGLWSFMRNIWDRIAHSCWTYDERYYWYYNGFPEKQADELGGVKR